ncbi:hypothetical protein Pse7367_0530 [Thalassoporum mexicanum PCC 7367]|uniref:hypothetical protein n=1 Tax=Thalassoporum mexicanum TaxID=3457544 RepID=UPI00029FF1F1|nr:hypothetical protein [Pseudanabaena sp. PCC 7367]AFY68838.1 hypothetical protein Pse7367_0530 [Pseudanabaena sp. PCC 7367]
MPESFIPIINPTPPSYGAQRLDAESSYYCPICRRGTIAPMIMMEAFACNLCQHIFEPDLKTQTLKTADSFPPLVWRWNGRIWQGAHREGIELGWGTLVAAIAILVIPTLLVGSSVYIYAPRPGVPLWWFPYVWTLLVFICHAYFLLRVAIDYYQFPVWLYLRSWGQSFTSLWQR